MNNFVKDVQIGLNHKLNIIITNVANHSKIVCLKKRRKLYFNYTKMTESIITVVIENCVVDVASHIN